MSGDDHIHAQYRRQGYSEFDPIVIDETATTQLRFEPGAHSSKGPRGKLVRVKKERDGVAVSPPSFTHNFSTMKPGEGIYVELGTEAFETLRSKMNALAALQQSGQLPTHNQPQAEYVSKSDPTVIVADDRSRADVIRELLKKGHSEDIWLQLVEDNPSLASKLASAQIQMDRTAAIAEFESLLTDTTINEDVWHDFFKRNRWMLDAVFSVPMIYLDDEVYLGGKLARGRNGLGGVATDYLFKDASTKSFAAIELKTPDCELIGAQYRGDRKAHDPSYELDNEVYSVHPKLSGAVVQVRNQMAVAQRDFVSALGRTYDDLESVHPVGIVIAGTYSTMRAEQQRSFNHFRRSLHGVQVIAFDELLLRLRSICSDPEGGGVAATSVA